MPGYAAKAVCSRCRGPVAKSAASRPPQKRQAATQTQCACADVLHSCREPSCKLRRLQLLLQECSEQLRGLFVCGIGGDHSNGIDQENNSTHETAVRNRDGGAGESDTDSDSGGETLAERQIAIGLRPRRSAARKASQRSVRMRCGDSPDTDAALSDSNESDSDDNKRDSDYEPSPHEVKECKSESDSNSGSKAIAEKKAVGKQSAAKYKLKGAATSSKQTEGKPTAAKGKPCPKRKKQIVDKANVPVDLPAKRLRLRPLKLLLFDPTPENEGEQTSQTTPTELKVTVSKGERSLAEEVLSSSSSSITSPSQSPNKIQLRKSKPLVAESSDSASVVASRDSSCEDLERGSQPQEQADKERAKESVKTASPRATRATRPDTMLQRKLRRARNPHASTSGASFPAALHQDKARRELFELLSADLEDVRGSPTQHGPQQDSDPALSKTAWQTMIPEPDLQEMLDADVKEEVSSVSSPPASELLEKGSTEEPTSEAKGNKRSSGVPEPSANAAGSSSAAAQRVQKSEAQSQEKKKTMAKTGGAGRFTCENCGKQFRFRNNLYTHVTATRCLQKKVTLHCLVPGCERGFSSNRSLKYHVRIAHKKIVVYPCDYCWRQFKKHINLVKHQRRFHVQSMATEAATAPPDDTDPCALCGHPAINKFFLEVHMARHLHGGKYICMECLAIFDYDDQLARHIESDHPDSPKELQNPDSTENIRKLADLEIDSDKNYKAQFDCSFCDKSYSHIYGLEKHRKSNHPMEVRALEGDDALPAKEDELFFCPACLEMFDKEKDVKEHYQKHEAATRIKCVVCGQFFECLKLLMQHMNTHHFVELARIRNLEADCNPGDGTQVDTPKGPKVCTEEEVKEVALLAEVHRAGRKVRKKLLAQLAKERLMRLGKAQGKEGKKQVTVREDNPVETKRSIEDGTGRVNEEQQSREETEEPLNDNAQNGEKQEQIEGKKKEESEAQKSKEEKKTDEGQADPQEKQEVKQGKEPEQKQMIQGDEEETKSQSKLQAMEREKETDTERTDQQEEYDKTKQCKPTGQEKATQEKEESREQETLRTVEEDKETVTQDKVQMQPTKPGKESEEKNGT